MHETLKKDDFYIKKKTSDPKPAMTTFLYL